MNEQSYLFVVSGLARCDNHSSSVSFRSGGNGRGATTAEKLRETKVWVPTPGRLRPAPGQRPGWVLGAGAGGDGPLPLRESGGIAAGNFFKIQMLNFAFW